jgi:hypothetical protein
MTEINNWGIGLASVTTRCSVLVMEFYHGSLAEFEERLCDRGCFYRQVQSTLMVNPHQMTTSKLKCRWLVEALECKCDTTRYRGCWSQPDTPDLIIYGRPPLFTFPLQYQKHRRIFASLFVKSG